MTAASDAAAPGQAPPGALEAFRPFLAQNLRLIVVTVVLFFAIALGLSLSQERQYDAVAKLSFSDAASDVSLTGVAVAANQQAPQVAAAGVTQVQRTGVFDGVARNFGAALPDTPMGPSLAVRQERFSDRLEDATSAAVEPDSNLVAVTVRWPDGTTAARLANLVATQTADNVNGAARRGYERRADELRSRVVDLPRGRPGSIERQTREDYQSQISRLVSLSTLASPVQVASRANPVTTPAVPKPVLTSTIGAFLGLIVAIGLAVVRRALDRRVSDTNELATLMGQPLTGQFPESVLGVNGPLVQDDTARAGLLVDYARVLRQNLAFLDVDEPIKVVVVTSATEGEGKSTVASSLAVAAASAGDSVLLIDADLRRPVVADRFGVAPEPGLSDHLVDDTDPQAVLRSVQVKLDRIADARGFTILPAGRLVPQPADILDSGRFRLLLSEVREAYDLVIIDTAPLMPVPDTSAIVTQADAVVLCCRIDEVSREAFVAGRERLERLDIARVAIAATGITKRRAGGTGGYGYDQAPYYGYGKSGAKSTRRSRRRARR